MNNVRPYDGKDDPEQWFIRYETAIRAAGGDEKVMANCVPVVLGHSVNQWLLRQCDGSIHSWGQLKHMMIDSFKPTCDQPGTRFSLAQIRDYPNEPL